jgi:hypothetical protein
MLRLALPLALAVAAGAAGVVPGLTGRARAAADEPAADAEPRKREAKDRFLRGLALAGEQRWDAALAEFLASRELFPTRVAAKNAAICLERLGRYAEALEMTTALLRDFGAQMPPEERAQVEASLGPLRRNVGEIEIDVDARQGRCAVAVDGRPRGSTPLGAPLTVDAGTHSVRVSQESHEPFDAQVVVAGGQRRRLRVALRALAPGGTTVITGGGAGAAPAPGFHPHPYLEAAAGGAFAPSFGGAADASCGGGGCSDRTRPVGALAGARLGYRLAGGLGVELFAGYAYLTESLTRRAEAVSETIPLVATDYRDATTLSGPLAALSGSYRLLDTTPLTLRVWIGAARARVQTSNRGTFSGDPASGFSTQVVSVAERPADVWLPVLGPEVRLGYRIGARRFVDFGLAVLWAFPPATPRVGNTALSMGDRVDVLPSGGNFKLAPENSLGTFVTFLPTLGVTLDL